MNIKIFFQLTLICIGTGVYAQLNNVNHIAFPPTPNPPLSAVHYTRAAQTISLQCNSNNAFAYGLTSMSTSGFLNLSISPYPNFVSSAYLGSAINPRNNSCGVTPNLDITKPVGETAGQFNVSANGAATYEIPIQISPGTNQIQPALSISYNSQGALGLLGIGWNLNGLSAISRSNKIPLTDGKFIGPLLNQSDVFALDGNRLFASNGVYGSANTNYYTEQESFATITSYGSLGNGPEKFEIQDKNGNIIQFGYTANARLQGSGNITAMSWYKNKFTDEFGNYMDYYYKQLNGELVIDEIRYTGNANAGLQTYNRVSFDYIPLAESNASYLNGAEFKQTQLLKEITCWAGTNIFKKYTFEYEWKEGTYLAMIKETDANGLELNPIFFCYENPDDLRGVNTNTQSLNTNFTTNDYIDMINIPADFNADGFSDFACFNPSAGRLRIYQNNFVNTFNSNSNSIGFSKVFDNPVQVGTNELMLSSCITDVNKDGKQELYCIFSPSMYVSYGSLYSNQYYVLKASYDINNNVVVSNEGTYYTSNVFNLQATPSPFMFNVQDYTGDGFNDQLKIDNESITLYNGLNTYSFALPNTINTFARPFNYDNDGIPEYIINTDNGTSLSCYFVKFNGSALTAIPGASYTIPFSNNGLLQKNLLKHISFGDLNGDGIDDILYMDEYNATLSVRYGNGLGFLTPKPISCYTSLNVNNAFDISCVDLNADGKMDIMINEQIGSSNATNYYSYLSFGDVMLKGGSYQGNWQVGMATKTYFN
ncbi:MAG: FG-GAP-like repeat-containing protein, partial [Bacteroidota bacterium]